MVQIEQTLIVNQIVRAMQGTLKLDEVLQSTVDQLQQVLRVSQCLIFRPTTGNEMAAVYISETTPEQNPLKSLRWEFSRHYYHQLVRGEPVVLSQIDECVSPQLKSVTQTLGIQSLMIVPLLYQDSCKGSISLHQSDCQREWTSEEVEMVQLIADLLAVALQQSEVCERLQGELAERRRMETALRKSEEQLQQRTAELQRVIEELQQAQDELRQDQPVQLFAQLVENIDQALWISTPKSDQLFYVNPAYEAIWNLSCETLYANPQAWLDVIHPEDRDSMLTRLKTRNQEGYEQHYRIVKPDGSIRWLRDKAFPVRNKQEEVYRFVGIVEDFTERKLAEQTLQVTQEQLQAFLDNSPAVIYLIDEQDRHLLANRQYETLVSMSRNQLVGKSLYEIWPPELADAFAANNQRVRESGLPIEVEEVAHHEDGLHTYISVKFPLRNASGIYSTVCGISTDITARKRVEEALRESEQMFRQLAENIHQVFWMTTQNRYEIIYLSPAYELIWGSSRESLYQDPESWLETIHPEDRQCVKHRVESGSLDALEYRIVRPDGSIRWLLDRCFPVYNEQGQVYRVAGIAEDITQRKQAEAEIRKSLEKERELNEMKSTFISVVSHEFRTPLSSIILSAELLEKYSHKIDQERKQIYFQRIKKATSRMRELLENVLLIGKAQAGSLEFRPGTLDLVKFCRDLVEEFQLSASYQHSLIFIGREDCPPVCMDAKLLQHIFSNLLSNAIKYSPQGGIIRFELSADDVEAIFSVQDSGIGIPLTDQEKLFASFYRATNVSSIPGTGLGLSIVKQCVDLHKGEILVKSEIGRGTTFIVKLPLNRRNGGDYDQDSRD